MVADPVPGDEYAQEPSSTQPQPASAYRLEVSPLIQWPSGLSQRLTSLGTLQSGAESTAGASTQHLLGYCDPAAGLAAALANGTCSDVAALLSEWHEGCLQLLRRWREQPELHKLINLSRLDPAAEIELLRRLGRTSDGPTQMPTATEKALPAPPQLPAVVAHYLAQRDDVVELYADLEGCAELLGRDPELPSIRSSLRGLTLAERLLDEWQAERDRTNREAIAHRQEIERQRAREDAERLEALQIQNDLEAQLSEAQQRMEATQAELQGTQAELQATQAELQASRAEIQTIQAEREQLRRHAEENEQRAEQAGQEAQETTARLHDLEEERELVLLQLKQVQDELIHTFQEQSRLQEQSEALKQECHHLFLHSRLDPEIDRTRISTILQLVRETLQV